MAGAVLVEDTLQDFERLDPGALPDVAPDFVERIASALAAIRATPPAPPGPYLPPEARRVFASPVLVLCSVIVLIHAMALRASRE